MVIEVDALASTLLAVSGTPYLTARPTTIAPWPRPPVKVLPMEYPLGAFPPAPGCGARRSSIRSCKRALAILRRALRRPFPRVIGGAERSHFPVMAPRVSTSRPNVKPRERLWPTASRPTSSSSSPTSSAGTPLGAARQSAGPDAELRPHGARAARTSPTRFTCQPVCGPARAVLQTGRYATDTGVFRNGIPLPPTLATLAQGLRRRRLPHRLHRQVAPRRRRAGAGRRARRLRTTGSPPNLLEFTSDAYDTVLFDGDGEPSASSRATASTR